MTANAAGRVKLVVLTLLSYKISSNIYNYLLHNSVRDNCLLEFEKNEGRIAITDLTTRIDGWMMEAETPRRWIRRPESRPPDGNDDGATELDAGAEIDVGSGRPTGAQEVEESRTPVADLGRQDGAAELTLTEIDAGSGARGQRSGGGHRRVGSGRW